MIFSAEKKLGLLFRKGFVQSVAVLVGGTVLGQMVTVMLLPVVSRLYSPADFSVLAVYASTLAIISAAAGLRLELAIPIPLEDDDALSLLVLTLLSSAIVSLTTGVILYFFSLQIAILFSQQKLAPYFWLFPFGIWLTSTCAALQYWSTRKKNFRVIATTRMTQACLGAATQIGLGVFGVAPFGLLLGHIINSGAGLLSLGRFALKDNLQSIKSITFEKLFRVFRQFSRFPKYATLEVLANAASAHLPVIIIATITTSATAGYLYLAMRVMAIPMSLVGGAVAQVYISRAPEEARAGNLDKFTLKVIGGLIKTGIGPLIFVGIITPSIFPIIFGSSWETAGRFIVWMMPWFLLQFLSSPVSVVLDVTSNQKISLILQILGLIIRVGAVYFGSKVLSSHVVEIYAISGFIFYCIYFFVVLKISEIKFIFFVKELYLNFRLPLIWIFFGIAIKFLLNLLS